MEHKCYRRVFLKKEIIFLILAVVFSLLSARCASKGIKGFHPPKLNIKDIRFEGDDLVIIAENFLRIQFCVEGKCRTIPEGSIVDSKITIRFKSEVEEVRFIFWGFGGYRKEIYINLKERRIQNSDKD